MSGENGLASHSESRAIIPDEVFNTRLQDKGCKNIKLPKQTYNKNKVLGVGPIFEEVYHYGLSVCGCACPDIF